MTVTETAVSAAEPAVDAVGDVVELIGDRAIDIATDVAMPAAKWTVGRLILGQRRRLIAVAAGVAVLAWAFKAYQTKKSHGSGGVDTLDDIPTIQDRHAA